MSEAPTIYQAGAGMRLSLTRNGHVVSPMFTYDCRDEIEHGRMTYYPEGKFHQIKAAARDAFASILGIQENEVIVSEIPKDGEIWWRLGTAHKCPLPKPKQPLLNAGNLCIDI